MFEKGMIISVENLKGWRALLEKIEKHTNYMWGGAEGLPTNMPDSSFYKYKEDCGLLITRQNGDKVLYYGQFREMVKNDGNRYKSVLYKRLCQPIKRF